MSTLLSVFYNDFIESQKIKVLNHKSRLIYVIISILKIQRVFEQLIEYSIY